MPNNFKVTVTKSFNGISNAYETNNTHVFEYDGVLTDPKLRENLDFIVETERGILAPEVTIKDATLKELAQGGIHRPHRSHVTKTYNMAGARTGMGDLLPYNVVASVERQANYGATGTVKYRGALGELDCEVASDGKYSLILPQTGNAAAALTIYCEEMVNGLPHGAFVFPHSAERADDENREIVRYVLKGIEFKQMHNESQSWEDDLEDATKKLINQGESLIRKIIKGHAFNGFNQEHIKALGTLAIKIQYLLKALPPERASEIFFGEIWNGIPIPNLPGLPGFNFSQS